MKYTTPQRAAAKANAEKLLQSNKGSSIRSTSKMISKQKDRRITKVFDLKPHDLDNNDVFDIEVSDEEVKKEELQ